MNNYSIIVAIADNNAIGSKGDLMWHIHDDMIFFRNTTRGHPVLMGRKTWDSLQKKPLPKRENIVLTKNKDFAFEGIKIVHSMEEAKQLPDYNTDIFIIGGQTIYNEFIHLANTIYLTRIYHHFAEADTFFPEIDMHNWQEIYKSEMHEDEESKLKYQFITLQRK